MDAAATPLPSEETTPPVTKIYFGRVAKVSSVPLYGDCVRSIIAAPHLSVNAFKFGSLCTGAGKLPGCPPMPAPAGFTIVTFASSF